MSRGSRSKTIPEDGEPTGAEQVAFLRGVAFAYQRAAEMLREAQGAETPGDDSGQPLSGEDVSHVRAEIEGAARIAAAASCGSSSH